MSKVTPSPRWTRLDQLAWSVSYKVTDKVKPLAMIHGALALDQGVKVTTRLFPVYSFVDNLTVLRLYSAQELPMGLMRPLDVDALDVMDQEDYEQVLSGIGDAWEWGRYADGFDFGNGFSRLEHGNALSLFGRMLADYNQFFNEEGH